MIVLACVPPVWRRVMDPRVLAHYEGDLTRANIHPAQAREDPGAVRDPVTRPKKSRHPR